METRASHILVGSFVLAFLAGLIAFAIWIAKVDLDAEYREYDILFDGSVSGLYKRSIVYYLGIPVGDVRDITLAPNDTRKVRVHVRLRDEVPVNASTTARLEFQGLTGVAYIELKGGAQGGERLKAEPGHEYPVIAAEASPLMEFYESAPNLVNEAILAIVQVRKLLSDENIGKVASVLDNANRAATNLADGTEDFDTLVADAHEVMLQVNETAAKLGALADSGNKLLAEDGEQLMAEAIETMNAAQAMLERVDALVAANEDSVTQFVSGSLPEVSRMIMDLRSTARSLSRLVSKIEQNPAETLFGPNQSKYDLDARKVKETKE
ncbi:MULTISPECIES: MlaD family protein [Kordiimonas]|jgi:phospholipid/cholesterol/gamma-HCH transport system substrate-binding protein|uniref:Phospholipid/cholesterol/gamma-HCH transport system substrate-binding protein n=1 Tax=Kordiimonas lacus TaxID=637679 RepID=A0A1G6XP34_9PROT|nr:MULTISPECIES: MlaD family protein [Kordiimonas]SDD79910.1 phospholipid/cholesterol/gamma-HCH transport system substrate-binding protein [Kordiimonas lacus]